MPPQVDAIDTVAPDRIATAVDDDALPDTMTALYGEYGDAIARFCAGRLHDSASIDDACHETFLRARRYASSFRAGERVWPWLATIAANVCKDIDAKQGRVQLCAEPPVTDEPESPHDETIRRQQHALVAEAMRELPARHRTLLYLRDVEGWSWEELSQMQGKSVPSIRSALWRAHGALRQAVTTLAQQRRWPLPAVIGALWIRLRDRVARARISAETALTRVSRNEGALSLLTGDAAMRLTAGTAATLAVVAPLAIGPPDSATTGTGEAPTEVAAAVDAAEPASADHPIPDHLAIPNHRDLFEVDPSAPLAGTEDGAVAGEEEPTLEADADVPAPPEGSGDAGGDPAPLPAPQPSAEAPEAPVTSSASTGGVESGGGEHEVTSPSADVDLGEEAPEEADDVTVGSTVLWCPPEDERSDAMSAACTPMDATEDDPDTDLEEGSTDPAADGTTDTGDDGTTDTADGTTDTADDDTTEAELTTDSL